MKILLYENLQYEIPVQPKKELIAGYNLPKKQQKFKRTEEPENWTELSLEEQMAFAEQEDARCTKGFWFYNNGAPVYITGDHYFYINWFKIDVGYPSYRDVDRRWFYFWEVCDKDPICIGIIYTKKRRDGGSYRAVSILANRARKMFNSEFGMVSKTGIDGKKLFEKFTYGFSELPENWMKPQVAGKDMPNNFLKIRQPQGVKTHKTKTLKKSISLNNEVSYRDTTTGAFDSVKLKYGIGDEGSKWHSADFSKWSDKVLTTMKEGSLIIGKAIFLSSVDTEEDAKKVKYGTKLKSMSAYKKVWDGSSYLNRDSDVGTKSGLYRYFVPMEDGFPGYIDEYGNSQIEQAKEWKQKKVKQFQEQGDTVGLYEFCRQNPSTIEEAFRPDIADTSMFDVIKINEQMDYNNSTRLPVVTGNFEWKGGLRGGLVEWRPSPTGRFSVVWMPPPEQQNKHDLRFGKKMPANTHEGVFGLDPYGYSFTVNSKRSNAALYGYRKLNPMDPENSDMFVLEYVNRPPTPDMMFEDVMKACMFYGWKVLIEKNVNNVIQYMDNMGMSEYMMKRPALSHTEYSEKIAKGKNEIGVASSGEELRRKYLDLTTSYIYNRIGDLGDGKCGKCYFNKLLECWLLFDVDRWTEFDEFVGASLALLGTTDMVPRPIQNKTDWSALFPKYDNKGTMSKKI